MLVSAELHHLPIESIHVDRENRQRRKIDIGDLISSIRARGILLPLLVDSDNVLVAGERRFETAKFLGLATVPCRIVTPGTSADEIQIIELEENIKRSDLTWQEKTLAITRIHTIYSSQDPDWTRDKTAALLGLSDSYLDRQLVVGESLVEGDKSIIECDGIAAAVTILTRRRARAGDALMEATIDQVKLIEDGDKSSGPDRNLSPHVAGDLNPGVDHPESDHQVEPAPVKAPAFSILNANTLEFFNTYEGDRFNFLHCDFPYGVELHGQANQGAFEGEGYDSNPEIYWELCSALTRNWERIMYPSAHVMFWISMKFYEQTVEHFREAGPSDLVINPTPLIWHKTDNRGILPDPLRGPRNIYEAALIMSTGDRKIVKPIANVYGCPTSKGDSIHTNEKPEPMLAHFFSMFVDEHSRVLDPTCGSGSSIRTAERLGAEHGLGLEINPEFAQRAQDRLTSARNLKSLSDTVT